MILVNQSVFESGADYHSPEHRRQLGSIDYKRLDLAQRGEIIEKTQHLRKGKTNICKRKINN